MKATDSSKKKIIQINPDFLKRTKKVKKRQQRLAHRKLEGGGVKPNGIKKELMRKIKDFRAKEQARKEAPDSAKDGNSFRASMDQLNTIMKAKGAKRDRRRKSKRNRARKPGGDTTLSANMVQLTPHRKTRDKNKSRNRPAPAYSNLKNGTKPTFNQYKCEKVLNQNKPAAIQERQNKLATVRYKRHKASSKSITNRRYKRRTLRVFRLGKCGRKVGVLVRSRKTKKKIARECAVLKKATVPHIKKYLRRHNLLKIGSAAPEDVLRKLYEAAYLSGDIYNRNPDYLLHNYLAGASST